MSIFHCIKSPTTFLTAIMMPVPIVADLDGISKGPVSILVPLRGFSAFDSPPGPLPDPEAPQLFAQVLQENLAAQINPKLLTYHINDSEFSRAIIEAFYDLLQKGLV